MNNSKTITHTIIVSVACFSFLVITAFYHHIDKHLTGAIFIILTLLVPITFITIIVFAIKGLIKIFRKRNLTLPTIISIATLSFIFFSPWQFSSESLESNVEIRACYEGTQNQSYIKFREDKSFEIHSTGAFFGNSWYTGQWAKSRDTIYLKFDNGNPGFLTDTLIVHNGYLIPSNKIELVDSTKDYRRFFYLGYCKGLN